MVVGADAHIGPLGSYEFAADPRKIGAFCRADVGIGPLNGQVPTDSHWIPASRCCLPQPLRHCAPAPLERGASGCRLLLERDAPVWEGEDVLEGLVSCGEDFESGLERVVDRLAAGFKDTLGQ